MDRGGEDHMARIKRDSVSLFHAYRLILPSEQSRVTEDFPGE